MSTQDTEDDGESKARPLAFRKFWVALCTDLQHHDIVGFNVRCEVWPPALAWIWMLMEASFTDRTRTVAGRTITLKRGQLALADRYLAKKAGWTRKRARAFLLKLARNGMVELSTLSRDGQLILDFAGSQRAPGKGPALTIVTIKNYDTYQAPSKAKGANKRSAKGPLEDQSTHGTTDTQSSSCRSSERIGEKEKDTHARGTDGASGERLPFSESVIRDLMALTLDQREIEELIAKYQQRTKGKRIKDPSAYLLGMGQQAAAKKLTTTVEAVKNLTSRNREEQVYAAANVVGAFSKPSEQALKSARRANSDRAERALALMDGRSFTSQAEADRAFQNALVTVRFSSEQRSAA